MKHLHCAYALALAAILQPAAASELIERDWWTVRSESFVLYTDASPERGGEIAFHLELFRRAFARLAPEIELRNPTPTKIVAFRDRYGYARYHPQAAAGRVILGAFLRHPDGNFLTLDAGAHLEGGFGVIYHEFVHYLVEHNFPAAPRWFDEGLAEYYSTFRLEGESAVLGLPVARHLRWLRHDNHDRKASFLSHDLSLDQVLSGEAVHHDSKVGGFYAFSWALVHYLLSGSNEQLDQTADYLTRLRAGEEPSAAFRRAFDVGLEEMEETLRAYGEWPEPGSLARLDRTETLYPVTRFRLDDFGRLPEITAEPLPKPAALVHLGDLLSRMGYSEAAELHFQEALELDSTYAEAHAGLALVRDREGRFGEAALYYEDALRLGSKEPLTYLRYGRHLLAQLASPLAGIEIVKSGMLTAIDELASTSELVTPPRLRDAPQLMTARRSFKHAVTLDSDFAQAQLLFGVSHLFGDVDPAPGVAAVDKVRRSLPADDGVAFSLLQLLLKQGDLKRAERLFRQHFRDHRNLELSQRAEEEVERGRLLDGATAALEAGETEKGLRLFDEAVAVTSSSGRRARMAELLIALEERLRAGTAEGAAQGASGSGSEP